MASPEVGGINLATLPQELIDLVLSFLSTSEKDLQRLRATNRRLSNAATYPLADVYEERLSMTKFLTNRYALTTLLGLVRVHPYRARMQRLRFLFASDFLNELSRQFGVSDVIKERLKEQMDFETIGKGDAYDILLQIFQELRDSDYFQSIKVGVFLGPNIMPVQNLPCFGMERLGSTVLPYYKRRDFQAMRTSSKIPTGATNGDELGLMMKALKQVNCLDKLTLDIQTSTNFGPIFLNTGIEVAAVLRSYATHRIKEIELHDGHHKRVKTTTLSTQARPPEKLLGDLNQFDTLQITGYEHRGAGHSNGEIEFCSACIMAEPFLDAMPMSSLTSLSLHQIRLDNDKTLCQFLQRHKSTLKVLFLSRLTLMEEHWKPILQYASSMPALRRFHGALLRQFTHEGSSTVQRPYVGDHVLCDGADEVKKCLRETVEEFTLVVERQRSYFVVFAGGVVNSFS
ncbi:hypothetical protein BDV96DRAFT_164507 [Lophiotrema nucula]|uniref:F-box domain-containing protein n=1 Tax=Lophiotrema nucula TaxID=690887 RepID=A0A6A5Z0W6_9PLEO|nr:hypothetical protein BDV96DRAFT_164507 [Lophiotrema nucula]